ncbi:MAG: tRNA pseudouridine(38-40) synthase TruA [Gammaproteobacteria bacterium]|nr:MAG: tRNA pseudouridine(38-40) synthase TruA [Gammaproteobacteria bacterium]
MTRIALGLEYDGAAFCGWQIQDAARSVQACVEQALSRVADHPVRVICAGRTDAGVHALGQVVHFDTGAARTPRAWVFGANTYLPHDVSVLWAQPMSGEFHARFSAIARHYRYVILNRAVRPAVGHTRVSWCYRPLDVARMDQGAQYLAGEHDFSAYRAVTCQAKHALRTVYRLHIARHGELVVLEISANAFLHHMVRNIAGVLMEIGSGAREPVWAREVLESRDRTLGGVTAPPQGLTLAGVDYPAHFGLPPLPASAPVW